jgi:hypothetical protein
MGTVILIGVLADQPFVRRAIPSLRRERSVVGQTTTPVV